MQLSISNLNQTLILKELKAMKIKDIKGTQSLKPRKLFMIRDNTYNE